MEFDPLLLKIFQTTIMPENYFVLTSVMDWYKLYETAGEKNAILCIEFHDESFSACRTANQHFLDLARTFDNLPFVQVKLSNTRKWPEVRKSVGGVDFVPCIVVILFLPDGKQRAKYEGEGDIGKAIRQGQIQEIIREFQKRRQVINSLEEIVTKEVIDIVRGSREREEAAKSELVKIEKAKEEEAIKKERARGALERREREVIEERSQNRPIILEELSNEIDIEAMSVGRLKEIFRRLHISIVGITEKSELLAKLYQEFPELRFKQRNVYDMYSYSTNTQITSDIVESAPTISPLQEDGNIYALSDKEIERFPTAKLMKYVSKYQLQAEGPLNERSDMIQAIKRKRDSAFKSNNPSLSVDVVRQDSVLYKTEINELNGRVLELTEKLTETKILSLCRLNNFQIIHTHKVHPPELTCQHTVRCNKEGLPESKKLYTLKGVFNYFNVMLDMHTIRVTAECEVLSNLQPHPNIVYHFANFYDRPTRQIGCSRSDLLDQIALFSITESIPYTIITYLCKNHKNSAVESNDYLIWMKQIISTFLYLTEKNIYLRSIKHENVMYDPETKAIKLIGFESAIYGQTVPFYSDLTSIGDVNSYLPPEILNAVPGPSNYLDYTSHYTWAAGALSYDLACNPFPFRSDRLDASQYSDSDVPSISCIFPYGSLSRSNSTPMSPQYSAMVLQMLRFRSRDRPNLKTVLSSLETPNDSY